MSWDCPDMLKYGQILAFVGAFIVVFPSKSSLFR